jgi:choline dehydrogenase-like flavoprotein
MGAQVASSSPMGNSTLFFWNDTFDEHAPSSDVYIRNHHDVVPSLGAINTPKVLMQSGIGDEDELQLLGIRRVTAAAQMGSRPRFLREL